MTKLVARWRGEEYLVLLNLETNISTSLFRLRKTRLKIEKQYFKQANMQSLR